MGANDPRLEALGDTPGSDVCGCTRVMLAEHPEAICVRCHGTNPVWSAPSPLWNEVMRGGDINGDEMYEGIVCPSCFANLATEAGVATGWRLIATDVHTDLQEVTPSGRVWNAETWLWEEPA